jgi:hypothetical protein
MLYPLSYEGGMLFAQVRPYPRCSIVRLVVRFQPVACP